MRLASHFPGELIPLPLSGSTRNYPMLQKSFSGDERNFLGSLMGVVCRDARDLIVSHKIDHSSSH